MFQQKTVDWDRDGLFPYTAGRFGDTSAQVHHLIKRLQRLYELCNLLQIKSYNR
jgi:hypothetical protein